MKSKILILTGDFAEEHQLLFPYQFLKAIGHEVFICSPHKKRGERIKTIIHDYGTRDTYKEKTASRIELNLSFDKVKHKEYDGLIIPGGRAPEYIKLDERVINTIIEIDKERKPIIAISKGIQLLTAANVIEGIKVTSCPSSINEIKLSKGKYISVDKDNVIVDHNIITAYGWHANPKLMQEFMKQLGSKVYI